jgi:hypothetical protein
MEQLLNKMSTLSEAKTVDGLVESLKYAKGILFFFKNKIISYFRWHKRKIAFP